MLQKRGQAALEFLMTYGWAILVVLVVIAALASFGVLNPDSLVPEKCTLVQGISCDDYQVQADQVQLRVSNGLGKTITILEANAWSPQGQNPQYNCTATPNADLVNGGSTTLTINQDGAGNGCTIPTDLSTKADFVLTVNYYFADSDPTFNHTITGELLANVEG